jgi:hypothetical protein
MAVNVSKTKSIIFHSKSKQADQNIELKYVHNEPYLNNLNAGGPRDTWLTHTHLRSALNNGIEQHTFVRA